MWIVVCLLVWLLTCSGWPSLSQVRVGGGTASDLHSRDTCLFSSTDTSWGVLSPAMLGGTVTGKPERSRHWRGFYSPILFHLVMHDRRNICKNILSSTNQFNYLLCNLSQLPSSHRLFPQCYVRCTLQCILHLCVTHHALEPGIPCHHLLLDCWLSSCICLCPPTEYREVWLCMKTLAKETPNRCTYSIMHSKVMKVWF